MAFLWGFVQYEAKGRVSAEAALRHAYFKSLGERVHLLPDSKCTLSSCLGTWRQEVLRSLGVVVCGQVSSDASCFWSPRGAPAAGWGGCLGAAGARNYFG